MMLIWISLQIDMICWFLVFFFHCVGVVVKGFDLGIASMKKGEKAVLTFKPDYAYGASGSPPNIPPNATLIFEVTHLSNPKITGSIDNQWYLNKNFRFLWSNLDRIVKLETGGFESPCERQHFKKCDQKARVTKNPERGCIRYHSFGWVVWRTCIRWAWHNIFHWRNFRRWGHFRCSKVTHAFR